MTSNPGWPQDATVAELGEQARAVLAELARRPDLAAFNELLTLSQYGAECLGESARTLAASSSWSQVAEVAGTTKQAAWSRWRL